MDRLGLRKSSPKMLGIVVGLIAFSSAVQLALVFAYVIRLRKFNRALPADADCPKAAVVLCLRGGDPFLSQCLAGLLGQNYPSYQVVVVIDHETDPANAWVEQALLQPHSCQVQRLVLDPSNDRCSLKCAGLVQAVRTLDERVKIVAQLDADTVPHAMWLREIAAALAPANVGAVTGNRWYLPESPNLAAMVRYQWNCGAVVLMYWLQIAWGGTLGMKREAIDRARLLERWEAAFCEDTMSFRELKSVGYRLEFVPSLMMINRESCRLTPFLSWLTRQLLTVRLYHPAWLAVAFHGLSAAAILVLCGGWSLVLLAQSELGNAALLGLTIIAAQFVLVSMVLVVDAAVRRIARQRGDEASQPSLSVILLWSWSIVLTQFVFAAAVLRCLTLQTVSWRGVHYKVRSAWEIQRGPYLPYEVVTTSSLLQPHESL